MTAEAKLLRLQRQVAAMFLVVVAMVGLFVFSALKPSPKAPPSRPAGNTPSYQDRLDASRAARDARKAAYDARMQRYGLTIQRMPTTPDLSAPATSATSKGETMSDFFTGRDGRLYRKGVMYPIDHDKPAEYQW